MHGLFSKWMPKALRDDVAWRRGNLRNHSAGNRAQGCRFVVVEPLNCRCKLGGTLGIRNFAWGLVARWAVFENLCDSPPVLVR